VSLEVGSSRETGDEVAPRDQGVSSAGNHTWNLCTSHNEVVLVAFFPFGCEFRALIPAFTFSAQALTVAASPLLPIV
jgi:hypothetical protein